MDKKFILLLNFSGAGSKLLQAQLSSSKEVFTIPAYPLKYLPFFFKEWKKKNNNLTPIKLFNLLYKHHKSIFDSRYLKGYNGLNNLGEKKEGYIKISKNKFKSNFIKFFKGKKINQKNLILAIHESYSVSTNKKSNKILYHVHDLEIFDKFLKYDFDENKILYVLRNPLFAFWRRAYSDNIIDNERFDYTDYENLISFRYINRLRDILLNIKNYKPIFKKNSIIIKFEDLKNKNKETLKNIFKILNLKFNYSKVQNPKFNNQIWWGSNVYKGHKENYKVKSSLSNNNDLVDFYYYEIFILEMALLPFFDKFGYKTVSKLNNNFINYIKFFLLLILPTKFGIKLLGRRLSLLNFIKYCHNAYSESFSKKKIKNYYFNGMYKFKWSYRVNFLIKLNFFRKIKYKSKGNFLFNVMYFLIKIIKYPLFIFEFALLYFIRIILILRLFLNSNKVKNLKKLQKK